LGLIAIVGWIAIEAVQRLISPEQVKAVPMLAIAVAGFLVNAGAFFLLHGADRGQSQYQGRPAACRRRLLASFAAIVRRRHHHLDAGMDARRSDPVRRRQPADPARAIGLVRKSWHVLMEATPEGVNVAEIAEALEALDA